MIKYYLFVNLFLLNINLCAQTTGFESLNDDGELFDFKIKQKMSVIPEGFELYKDKWVRNLSPEKTLFCGYEVESIYLWVKRKKLVNIKFYLKDIELDSLPKLTNDFVSILGPSSKIIDYQIDEECDYPVVGWVGTNIHLDIFVTKDYPELEKCSIVIAVTSSSRFFKRQAEVE